MVNYLFPEQAFSISERQANREQREAQQYSRQYASSERERQERYNNKVGQAEIDRHFRPRKRFVLVRSVVAAGYP